MGSEDRALQRRKAKRKNFAATTRWRLQLLVNDEAIDQADADEISVYVDQMIADLNAQDDGEPVESF